MDLSDFTEAKSRLGKLLTNWKPVTEQAIKSRALRYVDIDPSTQRQSGTLLPDETYVPSRLIDMNIRREQPQYLAFIAQSPRDCVFQPVDGEVMTDISLLETHFTSVCRYVKWQVPFIQVQDGSMTYGWDWVGVFFNKDAPGHFLVEHIGNEYLLFDVQTRNVQDQEVLLRRVPMTRIQLLERVKEDGWNAEQVQELLGKLFTGNDREADGSYDTYHYFFKVDGVVWSGWWSEKNTSWLKDPMPFYNGRDRAVIDPLTGQQATKVNEEGIEVPLFNPVEETEYPFFCRLYTCSENAKITDTFGRCRLDEWDQDAASALLSVVVNGSLRANNLYGCVPNQPDGTAPKQLNMEIKPMRLYDQKVEWYSMPFPPDGLMRTLQMLWTKNSQEAMQVNYAVNNREDSRKTATEITAAENKSAEISSVQVTLLSIFYQEVRYYCWRLYQNRVLQGKIQVPATYRERFFMDKQGNPRQYYVLPSGDVDVVKRNEKLQKLTQLYTMVANTPLAMPILQEIIKVALPEDAPRFAAMVDKITQGKQLVGSLEKLVEQLSQDHTGKAVPAIQGQEPAVMQLLQQAQVWTQTP